MHHSIELNGHKFYIRRMEPFTALAVLADLQQMVISPLLDGVKGKELDDTTKTVSALIAGLSEISSSLGRDKTVKLAKMLLDPEYISVEQKLETGGFADAQKLRDSVVTATLRGVGDILTLCVEVVRENYSDFLEPLAPLISKASSLLEAKSGVSLTK